MAQSDLVCDRETLQALVEDLRPRLRDDPMEMLRQVEGKGTSRRSADDFLSREIRDKLAKEFKIDKFRTHSTLAGWAKQTRGGCRRRLPNTSLDRHGRYRIP